MKFKTSIMTALAAVAVAFPAAQAQEPGPWRSPDPENVLVIDTNKGRIIAELEPALAPNHVERVKLLTRQGFYDGLKFFRVVDGFMAQTGDPLNSGEGGSALPDLAAEFAIRRTGATPFAHAPSDRGVTGFIGTVPVQSQPDAQMIITADHAVPANGLFCPGVIGVARSSDPNSGNSQFFLMREAYPTLNGNYTVMGRVLFGLDVVRSLKTGEPVPEPTDVMQQVRLLADIPPAERPTVQVMDTRSQAFADLVTAWRAGRGNDVDICDLEVPVSVQ
jgi:peptidylprolyl isomerase